MPKLPLGTAIRISVVGPPSLSAEQVRAYAEYKLFSRLMPLAQDLSGVEAVITAPSGATHATCTVAVNLGEAGRVRTRVQRASAVAAIDAAAETIAHAIGARLTRHTLKKTSP